MKAKASLIFGIILLLVGCGEITESKESNSIVHSSYVEQAESKNDEIPYLSITESYYENEKKEIMASTAMEYKNGCIREIGTVPFDSSYPLTCYSSDDGYIYYTNYDGKRDRIVRNDENNHVFKNDLCTFNYLSKCGDGFFSLAKHSKKYCMNPLVFDASLKNYHQIIDDPKDDLFCWAVGVDYKRHMVYFSVYSDDDMRKHLDTGGSERTHIYSYNLDTKDVKEIYNENVYIADLAASDGIVYIHMGDNWQMKNERIMRYNVASGKMDRMDFKGKKASDGDMEIMDNKLYYIGNEGDKRGLYSYDLSSHEIKPILLQKENAFINGFSLNY